MSDESRVKEILARRKTLKSRRGLWEGHWDDLTRVQLPRRQGFVTQTNEGDRRTEGIYDGTPMQAARALANSVGAMIRPEGEDWHHIRPAEDIDDNSDEAKDWFRLVDERMRDAFDNPKARMRQALGEADIDLVVLGTATVFTGEGDTSLLFQALHLKDVLPFYDEEGNPEGIIRDRRLTVRHAIKRFTLEKLSEEVRQKHESGDLDDNVNFVHAVLPRHEGRVEAILARNLPIADLWIEVEAEKLVAASGFHEFPFAIPRWDTSSGEDYGRSPGMIALPDSNTAQAIAATLLIAGQRAADPPLAVPDDSTFDAPNTFPGGLAYYDIDAAKAVGRIPIAPLDSGGNIPLTREMQNDMRNQVWDAFFRNLLKLPPSEREMTATEIIARLQEFIRELGPVFGRLESDYTAPIVERGFSIMLRAGAFDPIPEVLQGRNVRFEYQSPIKRSRQQVEAEAARLWAEEVGTMAANGKPEALDLINVDVIARLSAEAKGISRDVVNDADVVAQIRQQRADAEAAAAQMEQIAQGAEIVSTAANLPGVKNALEGETGEAA